MAAPIVFRELVRHFFGRFFDKESLSPQGQPEAGVNQTIGLLAAPSAFVSILTLPVRFAGWDLVGFRFLFICYSMIAMGVVMVFEWDALFPDRRDYQILTPLPLRVFPMFLAKMTALGFFLGIFLAAVSFFDVLFWPVVEPQGAPLSVAGTHLLVMCSAGLFSALSIAALQGVLVTLFRGSLYRRVSGCAQTLAMALLIMLLFLTPVMTGSIGRLCRDNSPLLRWFPAFWFAGLYEQLRPAIIRHPAPGAAVLLGLGTVAIRGICITLAIFALTFLPGYRSHARRILEAPEPTAKGPGAFRRLLHSATHWLLRDPVECAVFHFISQTIARSLKHRLFLATYGGFGAALVVVVLASGGSSRRIPLMLSFILVSGLRAAFNFPSDLRANWSFQISETTSVAAYIRATRKWVLLYAILPVLVLLAALEALHTPLPLVAFHFAFGVALSTVLMEAFFLDFYKVPFTCSHFPSKMNLVFLIALYVFGFTLYSIYTASLEDWLWRVPVAAVAFFIAVGGGLVALSRTRKILMGDWEGGLEYVDDGNPEVCTLGLSD